MKWIQLSAEEALGPLTDLERRNAPEHLFLAGDRKLLIRGTRVAVVGARRASAAGLRRAERLARFLVREDFTVVSGLALGIDTIAHETALREHGRTIAVLGGPLDQVHPARNADLLERIIESDLAVSQFPTGHPILRGNFPRRNRTMSLLCDASIIVEATDGSGSLSQGWEALRLGRPLFLLRSLTGDPRLAWPQEMLRHGALVLSEPEEVLDVLPRAGSEALTALAF